jgi:hypothetical protein
MDWVLGVAIVVVGGLCVWYVVEGRLSAKGTRYKVKVVSRSQIACGKCGREWTAPALRGDCPGCGYVTVHAAHEPCMCGYVSDKPIPCKWCGEQLAR